MTPANRAATKLAKSAGLRYIGDDQPGIRRVRRGRGFSYKYDSGRPVRDVKLVERIKSLAIPPAWTDVWICRDVRGHLQATGRDDRQRKQYLYHPQWTEVATRDKFERLEKLGRVLPQLRQTVSQHMRQRSDERKRVLALVVRLLELTGMRIGDESYLEENGSRGLTTLTFKQLKINGKSAELRYTGKGGKRQRVTIDDQRVLRILKTAADEEAESLFVFEGDDGPHSVAAEDVNDYLREVSPVEITTKDFRTWLASAQATAALHEQRDEGELRQRKKILGNVIQMVADRLGNTTTVCRASYLDPRVLEAYESGKFPAMFANFRCRKRRWMHCEDQILLHALSKVREPE